ncbi:hypothetical protein BC828DRAFT_307470 [Blastocladiella britannica]|nr:hypothetical protein BC828DRAFT_307470 [Blastocladiella britannica]
MLQLPHATRALLLLVNKRRRVSSQAAAAIAEKYVKAVRARDPTTADAALQQLAPISDTPGVLWLRDVSSALPSVPARDDDPRPAWDAQLRRLVHDIHAAILTSNAFPWSTDRRDQALVYGSLAAAVGRRRDASLAPLVEDLLQAYLGTRDDKEVDAVLHTSAMLMHRHLGRNAAAAAYFGEHVPRRAWTVALLSSATSALSALRDPAAIEALLVEAAKPFDGEAPLLSNPHASWVCNADYLRAFSDPEDMLSALRTVMSFSDDDDSIKGKKHFLGPDLVAALLRHTARQKWFGAARELLALAKDRNISLDADAVAANMALRRKAGDPKGAADVFYSVSDKRALLSMRLLTEAMAAFGDARDTDGVKSLHAHVTAAHDAGATTINSYYVTAAVKAIARTRGLVDAADAFRAMVGDGSAIVPHDSVLVFLHHHAPRQGRPMMTPEELARVLEGVPRPNGRVQEGQSELALVPRLAVLLGRNDVTGAEAEWTRAVQKGAMQSVTERTWLLFLRYHGARGSTTGLDASVALGQSLGAELTTAAAEREYLRILLLGYARAASPHLHYQSARARESPETRVASERVLSVFDALVARALPPPPDSAELRAAVDACRHLRDADRLRGVVPYLTNGGPDVWVAAARALCAAGDVAGAAGLGLTAMPACGAVPGPAFFDVLLSSSPTSPEVERLLAKHGVDREQLRAGADRREVASLFAHSRRRRP